MLAHRVECDFTCHVECNLTPSATLHTQPYTHWVLRATATVHILQSATLLYTGNNLTPRPTLHIMWSATSHIMRSATLQMVLPVPGTATHPGTATRPGRAPRRKGFRNWFRKGLPKPEHGFNPASHWHTKALRVEPLALAGCGGQATWGNRRQGGNPSSSVQVDILRYSGIAPDPPGYSGSLYLQVPSNTLAPVSDRSPPAPAAPSPWLVLREVWRRSDTPPCPPRTCFIYRTKLRSILALLLCLVFLL